MFDLGLILDQLFDAIQQYPLLFLLMVLLAVLGPRGRKSRRRRR